MNKLLIFDDMKQSNLYNGKVTNLSSHTPEIHSKIDMVEHYYCWLYIVIKDKSILRK